MPRDGSGIYSVPIGTAGVPNTTISSTKYNNLIADLVQDANAPRPIAAGGTGASTASAALTALGVSAFIKALLDDADAAAALSTLGVSAFIQTFLDDTDAATARATLLISDAFLRYDAAQTLTGTPLTQAQTNLRAILGGWYEHTRILTTSGTSWVVDLPDDATRFRLSGVGLATASGQSTLTARCGVTGGSLDAGASDYFNQLNGLIDASQSFGGGTGSSATLATFANNGFSHFIAEGYVGATASAWNLLIQERTLGTSSAVLAQRGSYRQAVGRKGRLSILSSIAATAGEIIVEVRK